MHTSTRRKRAPPSASEVPPAKFHNRELGRTRRKSERCVAASSPKFCRLPTDAYALEPSARFFSLISYSRQRKETRTAHLRNRSYQRHCGCALVQYNRVRIFFCARERRSGLGYLATGLSLKPNSGEKMFYWSAYRGKT